MPYSTRDYLLYWIARKQLSRQELINKAIKKGYPAIEIRDAVKFLEANGFINDVLLADNLIHFYHKQRGLSWIRQKARTRLIPLEVFDQAWEKHIQQLQENLKNTEATGFNGQPYFPELKQKILDKYKLTKISHAEEKIKHKIASFLAYRGFSPFEMINKWIEEEND